VIAMPWNVGKKTKKGWPIKRSDTGEVVGYSKTKQKAEASVRIRYMKSHEFAGKGGGWNSQA
jgi:hypothetical protein